MLDQFYFIDLPPFKSVCKNATISTGLFITSYMVSKLSRFAERWVYLEQTLYSYDYICRLTPQFLAHT